VLKSILLAAVLIAFSAPAFADQDNLDHGITDAVKTYKKGGAKALQTRAELCYSGIPYKHADHEQAANKAEYCFAYEIAATTIIQQTTRKDITQGYFFPSDVLIRGAYNAERAGLITDPSEFGDYMSPRMTYVTTNVPTL